MRALAILAVLGSAATAHAQSGGLGVAIPDAELPKGNVSVRVVLASMDRPATSLPVSVVDDASGKERVVRTDAQGRAMFAGLTVGKRYTAFTKIGETEIASDPFTMPSSGGLRILMSPAPIRAAGATTGGATGGAPAGHGGPMAGGMPDPRQMSGMARPESEDPAGTLTVRIIQGNFRDDPIAGRVADFPKDAVVHLVGYGRGGAITVQSETVDKGGRVQFAKLATDNSVSYYAMTVLARTSGGAPVLDRLMTGSIELLPQVGMRVVLAGHAADSNKPAIDDHASAIRRQRPDATLPAAGHIRIDLAGRPEKVRELELIAVDAPSQVIARAPVSDGSQATSVSGSAAGPASNAGLRDGLIQIKVASASPLAGSVKLVSAAGTAEQKTVGAATIGADGTANIEGVAPGLEVVAVLAVRGGEVTSSPFTIPDKGGLAINFTVRQTNQPRSLGASFSNVAPGKIYLVRTKSDGRTFVSQPVQMVADRGASGGILVYPALLVGFQGGAELDDDRMWFQLKFSIANPSLVPLDTGADGLLIPLPPGFKGASVEDKMAARIKVDEHGFVWRGAFPPGQRDFMASFAVPVSGGVMSFDMPLPYGAWDSHLVVEDFPGADLNVPSTANRTERTTPDGRKFVLLSKINISPGQSLTFSMSGLPMSPGWKAWARNLSGIAVLALLAWGFGAVFVSFGRRREGAGEPSDLEGRREALLSKVVALDQKRKKGKIKRDQHERDRARLIAQLETVYEQLERQ